MEKPTFTQLITWERIEISLTYKPRYFKNISHLEVSADEPLPITDTGYHSIWLDKPDLDNQEIETYVTDYLNKESNSNAWKSHLKTKKEKQIAETQFSLF